MNFKGFFNFINNIVVTKVHFGAMFTKSSVIKIEDKKSQLRIVKCCLLLSVLLCFSLARLAEAEEAYRRQVNFEWEPVEEAKFYEIELKSTIKSDKVYHFKTKSPKWEGKLKVGHYLMRARTLDARGVPGSYGDSIPLDVLLESTKILSPLSNSTILEDRPEANKTDVDFKWSQVGGADHYHIEIRDPLNGFKLEENVTTLNFRAKLPVASHFVWIVNAIGDNSIQSEPNSQSSFTIKGPRLLKPEFTKPESLFVREIFFKKGEKAETVDLIINRFDPSKKEWQEVYQSKSLKEEKVEFDPKWPGGDYKVKIVAKCALRRDSEPGTMEFNVYDGDRSKAAEFTHEIRQSIDRANGWYGIASYMATEVTYTSRNFDHLLPAQASYQALSGTGRIGLGYSKDKSPWGFLGTMDYSGIHTNQGDVKSMASEMSLVWRKDMTGQSEIRVQGGLFFREYVVAESDGTLKSVGSYDKASVLGPHLGAEYWYSLTPKLGFQLNAHLYESLIRVKTPNGQDLEPSLSTQYGVLGSYRLTRRLTGLAGISIREDLLRYKSAPSDVRYLGQENEVKIQGTYLNLVLEYNF